MGRLLSASDRGCENKLKRLGRSRSNLLLCLLGVLGALGVSFCRRQVQETSATLAKNCSEAQRHARPASFITQAFNRVQAGGDSCRPDSED